MFSLNKPPAGSQPSLAPSMFAPGGIQSYQNQQQAQSQSQNQNQGLGTGFSNNINNANPSTTTIFGPQQFSADSGTKIDIQHLRPTTKYDQLTQSLQTEIEAADAEIAAQVKQAEELEVLLPNVKYLGEGLKPQVELVAGKLQEVQEGFERDALEIVEIREGIVKRDEGEAKLCLREVERLKAPGQYQLRGLETSGVSAAGQQGISGSVYGGVGLSGWWNNPQVLRGSVRGGTTAGKGVQIAEDEDKKDKDESTDPRIKQPANLVDLFSRRADDMRVSLGQNEGTLQQIEAYIESLEDKIRGRERELVERMDYGALDPAENGAGDAGRESERAQQIRMLKYVFGEAERSLYEVAGKIGEVRDQVILVSQGEAAL